MQGFPVIARPALIVALLAAAASCTRRFQPRPDPFDADADAVTEAGTDADADLDTDPGADSDADRDADVDLDDADHDADGDPDRDDDDESAPDTDVSGWVRLACDDFESGDFKKGTGWTSAWWCDDACSGYADCEGEAHADSCAMVVGKESWYDSTANLSGFSAARFELWISVPDVVAAGVQGIVFMGQDTGTMNPVWTAEVDLAGSGFQYLQFTVPPEDLTDTFVKGFLADTVFWFLVTDVCLEVAS